MVWNTLSVPTVWPLQLQLLITWPAPWTVKSPPLPTRPTPWTVESPPFPTRPAPWTVSLALLVNPRSFLALDNWAVNLRAGLQNCIFGLCFVFARCSDCSSRAPCSLCLVSSPHLCYSSCFTLTVPCVMLACLVLLHPGVIMLIAPSCAPLICLISLSLF